MAVFDRFSIGFLQENQRTRPQRKRRIFLFGRIGTPDRFGEIYEHSSPTFTIGGAGVPGETWTRACVILNSGSEPAEVMPRGGRWSVALDQDGAAQGRSVTGKITAPPKSGFVLSQH